MILTNYFPNLIKIFLLCAFLSILFICCSDKKNNGSQTSTKSVEQTEETTDQYLNFEVDSDVQELFNEYIPYLKERNDVLDSITDVEQITQEKIEVLQKYIDRENELKEILKEKNRSFQNDFSRKLMKSEEHKRFNEILTRITSDDLLSNKLNQYIVNMDY